MPISMGAAGYNGPPMAETTQPASWRPVVLLAALAALISAILGWVWFGWSYFDPDTASYYFQAKLFAQGRLSALAPPDPGFASSGAINIFYGQWYAKSAWGNALTLAAGLLAGVPWLVPALETGLTLIVVFLFLERVYDGATARLTAALMPVSPAFVGIGAMWASEATSRLTLAIYLLGLAGVRSAWRESTAASTASALMIGIGLGAAFCTRPLTAAAFAVPGAIFLAWVALSAKPSIRHIAAPLGVAAAPFALLVASLLAYNAALTGHPLVFTQSAAEPLDTIGFGPRAEATYVAGIRPIVYTPHMAISRTLRHTLPAISFTTLGWGDYRPDLVNPVGASVESPVGGVMLATRPAGSWVALTLRGASTGAARLTLESRRGGAWQSWSDVVLDTRDGAADLRVRIASSGDGYRAFFSARPARDWQPAGAVPWRLDGPLDVGPFASRVSGRDPLIVTYHDFVVADATPGGLKSDPLAGVPGPWWRWNREPLQWGATASGVRVVADVHHSLHTDELPQPALLGDQVAHLSQTTAETAFDVAVGVNAAWRPADSLRWLRALPLAFVPLLAGVALAGRRHEFSWLLLGCLVASLTLYGLFYFEGSTVGRTPTHSRYHNEATVLAVLPLAAIGLVAIGRWLRERRSAALRLAAAAVAVALAVNTAHSFASIGRDYRNWSDLFQQLPRLVERANLHHVVVFLPHTHVAPVGDFPFAPLDRADVVYFRLGPSAEWGLAGRPWREVFRDYFEGRRAFVYEHEELRELDLK